MDEKKACPTEYYKFCPNKEMFEQQIEALEERLQLHLRLNAEALSKNDKILDERLMRMNEFRDALRDQANTFITRSDYQARYDEVQRQVDDLRLYRAQVEGKASLTSVYVAYGFSILSLILALLSWLEK